MDVFTAHGRQHKGFGKTSENVQIPLTYIVHNISI